MVSMLAYIAIKVCYQSIIYSTVDQYFDPNSRYQNEKKEIFETCRHLEI